MKRGDVVRTFAEFMALPVGSEAMGIDGLVRHRNGGENYRGPVGDDWLPALVRVVGPVEPEWLEAAAIAAQAADFGKWDELSEGERNMWRGFAKAAVAAADRARGVVNSREEFDALPAGTAVVERDWSAPARFAIKHKNTTPAPSSYPCFVIESRT